MTQRDLVEYWSGKEMVTRRFSSIVPFVGALINIRKVTYKVVHVSYAIDSDPDYTRANVELEQKQ